MRKILMVFSVVTVFAACNTKKTDLETSKDVVPTDTTGAYNNSLSTDTATMSEKAVVPAVTPPPVTRTITKVVTRKQAPKVIYLPAPTTQTNPAPAPVTPAPTPGTTTTTGTGSTGGTTTTTPTPAPEKKGWSNAAKGATIGGVGGAIGGAIISKKKGTGAIIGGVIGAAGGYILGRKKDKANQDTTGK
ncbi:MAG: YMGG-like glycine zipper-containing protein [Ginsengibacter sp.]